MKPHAWLWAIGLGFVVGGVSTGVVQHYFCRAKGDAMVKYFQELLDGVNRAQAGLDISRTLETLTGIQRGKTNYLVETLEFELGSAVSTLALEVPLESILVNSNELRLLDKVAAYRNEYPFRPENSEMDQKLGEILKQIERQRRSRGY